MTDRRDRNSSVLSVPARRAATSPRRARVAVVLLAAGLGLAGCGVPNGGPVVVVNTPPPAGVAEDGPVPARQSDSQVQPSAAHDPTELVRLYLTAAGTDPTVVTDVVTAFLTDNGQQSWRHTSGTAVLHVDRYQSSRVSDTVTNVRATGRYLGLLDESGAVNVWPTDRRTTFDHTFRAVRTNGAVGTEWRIDNPPSGLLLSDDALRTRYDVTPVYFLSPNQRTLVPDLRYTPKTVREDKRRTQLVEWLLAGPSSWLAPAVRTAFPKGVKTRGNVVNEEGKVVVDLSSDASVVQHPELMSAQLSWTLRPVMSRSLEIQIEGRPLDVPGAGREQGREQWRTMNAASGLTDRDGEYWIIKGKVISGPSGAAPAVFTDRAALAVNSGVVSAAISGDDTGSALVRRGPDGRLTLWLGSAPARGETRYTQVTALGSHRVMSRPSWIFSNESLVLAVDGQLYGLSGNGGGVSNLSRVSPDIARLGRVTAVSVPPDGCRIAFVAGGHPYVAPLINDEGGRRIGRPRQLEPGLTSVTELAWTQEDRVAIAGRGTLSGVGAVGGTRLGGLWEVAIDGLPQEFLPRVPNDQVPSYVAAQPDDPSNTRGRGQVLIQSSGRIYQLFSNEVDVPHNAGDPPVATAPFFAG